jgi:hypothetical protein
MSSIKFDTRFLSRRHTGDEEHPIPGMEKIQKALYKSRSEPDIFR